MRNLKANKCPNCGAPSTTEICPYCHNATGINVSDADMEFPVLDCKETNISFFNTWFPMIFAIGFGYPGIIFPIIFTIMLPEVALIIILMCSLFAIIGIISFVIAIKSIINNYYLKRRGKEIEATVYGYMDDNMRINDVSTQIVKLRIETEEGPRFILYQLGDIKQPYKANSKIKLLRYKNLFKIIN